MHREVQQEIEGLRHQPIKALKARYRELFGEDSRSSNHAHLFRRIAWRLQAQAEGGLSQRAQDRAAELAVDVDLRVLPPKEFWSQLEEAGERERSRRPRRDPRLPEPGTTVEREYQGQMVSVKVLKDGFEYQGQAYESLSSIASAVTGMRWNGFSFFRLKGTK
ncbi:MAG TPA: DUF2924 domain-containing protein [Bryobacteraceae bacterium]|jgi:hypothetical protein